MKNRIGYLQLFPDISIFLKLSIIIQASETKYSLGNHVFIKPCNHKYRFEKFSKWIGNELGIYYMSIDNSR